jgi:subtilisin family serine protease
VIGVASTNADGDQRASFSNWGDWCDCCTIGADVYSTFVYWNGAGTDFDGWATWNGTSFAAPRVSAAIARLFADGHAVSPVDAWDKLKAGAASAIDDRGVALPYLQIA